VYITDDVYVTEDAVYLMMWIAAILAVISIIGAIRYFRWKRKNS